MDITALEKLPWTWLETKRRSLKISWGIFIVLLCLFLFAIEISYNLRPDVNKFVGIAIYDIVNEGSDLAAPAVSLLLYLCLFLSIF